MRTSHQVAAVAIAILLAGAALGLALDANASIPQPWNRVSSVIGWVYFFCWGAEFYPQVVLNYRRKSVEGYSLDSALLAILGFASYAVFNVAFYYSASVQELYMARHSGNRNAVELNDVFFSLHATTMVGIAITQCLIYPSGDQRVSRTTKFIVYGTLSVAGAYAAAIPLSSRLDRSLVRLDVLDLLYYLSYVKLASTLAKEIPQLVLNYRRKSTRGWTVWTILLDIPGCVLSIAQQVLDSWATSDWSAITGNPVKIGLACVSLTLNTLYILQHYYWFADNNALLELEQGGEEQPLLSTKANAKASVVPSYLSHSLWSGRASTDEHAVDKSFWDVTAESARA